jgi:hypothetical protein
MAVDPGMQESALEATGCVDQEDDVAACGLRPGGLVVMWSLDIGLGLGSRIDVGHHGLLYQD